MVSIQLLIFIVFLIGALKFGGSAYHPAVVMLGSWIFMLLFQIVRLIHYEYEVLSLELLMLQTFFVGMFLLGSVFQIRSSESPSGLAADARSASGVDMVVLMLITALLIHASIVGFEIFEIGFSVLDIRQMRLAHWEETEYSHGAMSFTKAVARPMVVILVIMAPSFRGGLPRIAALIGFLVVGFAESLLAGGRIFLAFCILGWSISYFLHRDVQSPQWYIDAAGRLRSSSTFVSKVILSVLGVVLLYLCFGVFPIIRETDIVGNEDLHLSWVAGASQVSPLARTVSTTTGIESIAVFAYGSGYITSPMMRSNYLLKETDIKDWLFLGGNNFPVFSKIRALAVGGQTSEQLVKEKIAAAQTFGKNPWIGGVMDIVIDFGIYGGGFFMFLYGGICGWVFRSMRDLQHPEFLAAASVLSITLIAFPFCSFIRLSVTTFTLMVCFLAVGFRTLFGTIRVHLWDGA